MGGNRPGHGPRHRIRGSRPAVVTDAVWPYANRASPEETHGSRQCWGISELNRHGPPPQSGVADDLGRAAGVSVQPSRGDSHWPRQHRPVRTELGPRPRLSPGGEANAVGEGLAFPRIQTVVCEPMRTLPGLTEPHRPPAEDRCLHGDRVWSRAVVTVVGPVLAISTAIVAMSSRWLTRLPWPSWAASWPPWRWPTRRCRPLTATARSQAVAGHVSQAGVAGGDASRC